MINKDNGYLITPCATRKSLARALFRLADNLLDDQKGLQQLLTIADSLRLYLNNNPEQPSNGVGTEISCWIGLLIDTHEMGLQHRQKLVDSFPDTLGIFDRQANVNKEKQPPKVIFSHTKADEVEYLQNLEQERGWFKAHKFPAVLPPINSKPIEQYELHQLEVEKRIPEIEGAWCKIEASFFEILDEVVNLDQIKYYCHVSFFGPEGKYHRPNYLFVRANKQQDTNISRILETVAHELIHLAIANDADNNDLTYRDKECLVDSIFKSIGLKDIFPNYQAQNI